MSNVKIWRDEGACPAWIILVTETHEGRIERARRGRQDVKGLGISGNLHLARGGIVTFLPDTGPGETHRVKESRLLGRWLLRGKQEFLIENLDGTLSIKDGTDFVVRDLRPHSVSDMAGALEVSRETAPSGES